MDGWTSTQETDASRWELMKRHKLEAKRDAELAKIDAWYDDLRACGLANIHADAELFFLKDAILDEYEIGMAELEAQRLAQAIMPQFAGQLKAGLPEYPEIIFVLEHDNGNALLRYGERWVVYPAFQLAGCYPQFSYVGGDLDEALKQLFGDVPTCETCRHYEQAEIKARLDWEEYPHKAIVLNAPVLQKAHERAVYVLANHRSICKIYQIVHNSEWTAEQILQREG